MTKRLVGVNAIAAYLDRSPATVKRWFRAKSRTMIPIVKVGRFLEADPGDLDSWRRRGTDHKGS